VSVMSIALLASGCLDVPPPGPEPTPLSFEPEDTAAVAEDAVAAPIDPAPEDCEGYVALSFDDGPTANTGLVLDILERADVPATFFNRGDATELFPGYVEQTLAAGHQFGNHSYDHPDLLVLSPEEVTEQLERANDAQVAVVGDPFLLFRPPYGNTNAEIRAEAIEQGMVEVLWTVDSKDYLARDSDQIVRRSTGMEDGGILLLHDGKPRTIEALPDIINHYHGEGLCFGRIAPTDDEHQTDLNIPHNAEAVAP
jgi:peptidoglycan-N-acetylglucosamine deacetylase